MHINESVVKKFAKRYKMSSSIVDDLVVLSLLKKKKKKKKKGNIRSMIGPSNPKI